MFSSTAMNQTIKAIVFCQKDVYRSNKVTFALIYLVSTPLAFESFVWALANKQLVDILTKAITTNVVFSIFQLKTFFLLALVWLGITSLSSLFARYYREKLWRDHHIYFHKEFTHKIDALDLQTFEDSKFLDTLQNSQESYKAVIDTFQSTVNLYRNVLMGCISLLSISFLSPVITLVVGILTVSNIYINHKYYERRQLLDRQATPDRRMRSQLLNYFFNPASLIEMRIHALQDVFRTRYTKLDTEIHTRFMHLNAQYLPLNIISSLLEDIISDLGARLYIFYLAIIKRITLGQFAFYISQIGAFTNSLHRIGENLDSLNESVHRMKYYQEFLEVKPVLPKSTHMSELTEGVALELKNIDFTYPETTTKVLDNFSLTIRKGEKVAIIGLNGAGKTTIIKLMLRFYDPDSGQVLINGIDIKDINITEFYKKIGFMAQNYMTYEMTVADNVVFGRYMQDAKVADIETALTKASALEFVNTYPQGINQMLGRKFANSIQPSIGQWQKIGLARSFYRDPELLILDEPTSSIDAKAEAEIFEKVENIAKDKTVIIISHRFSTVRKADKIYLVQAGKIIEQGTHDELITLAGMYSQLFEMQAKGYK